MTHRCLQCLELVSPNYEGDWTHDDTIDYTYVGARYSSFYTRASPAGLNLAPEFSSYCVFVRGPYALWPTFMYVACQ